MKEIINTSIISDFMEENNLTIFEFCFLCNITLIEYKMVMSNDLDTNMEVMLKIADFMKASLDDLINVKVII